MTLQFRKAQRRRGKIRIGLVASAGAGKTYTSLLLAKGIGGKIALIDTENSSSELEAGKPGMPDFDVLVIHPPFEIDKYLEGIRAAEEAGYNVIILDSISHAWSGTGGLLDQKDNFGASEKNSFAAWRKITPMHNDFVDAMLQSPCHIIATMRAKTEYVIEEDEKGKKVPRKIGLAPVQREGMDFEFGVVFDIDQASHVARASKDRTTLFDGKPHVLTAADGQKLREWLDSGVDSPPIAKPELKEETKKEPDKKETKSNGVISASQVTRFWTIARNAKKSDDDVKALLQSVGVQSSKEIKTQHYDLLCAWGEGKLTDDDVRLAFALPTGDVA